MTTNDGYGGFFAGGQVPPAMPVPARIPASAPAAARATTAVPEAVTASAVLLVVAAVAALWLGLTMLTVQGTVTSNGGPMIGGVTWRGLLLVTNGIGDVALAYLLRQGLPVARVITAVVCAGWTVDWLYHATQTSRAFSQLSDFSVNGLGSLGTMATFGVLLLAVWAVATAGLLWTSAASEHFRR